MLDHPTQIVYGENDFSAATPWVGVNEHNGANVYVGSFPDGVSPCSSAILQTACPAGSYCPAGAFVATQCSAGTYSNAGASTCTNCAAGYSCSAGSTSATQNQCLAGTYSNAGASTCSSCTAGYWCSAGSTSATQNTCAAGTYSLAGATSSAACITCPAGSYCPGGVSAIACPSSTYYPRAGAKYISDCIDIPVWGANSWYCGVLTPPATGGKVAYCCSPNSNWKVYCTSCQTGTGASGTNGTTYTSYGGASGHLTLVGCSAQLTNCAFGMLLC